ncbi:MAG: aspartate kinase [Desulfobacteraceae bacterium]|nr:aspartate kinase [Desulfobacteraceae bacterium]
MKVIKVGGGCLKDKQAVGRILELIATRGRGNILVVSALSGITDLLIESIPKALADEENIPGIIGRLKSRHLLVARHLLSDSQAVQKYGRELTRQLAELERYFYGLNFTREITARLRDVICSYGERFSAALLAFVLRSRGLQAGYRLPHKIGLVTDGKFGDATVKMRPTAQNLQHHLASLLKNGMVLLIPGFFGVSELGAITTFGRGGSDYSAAVVAAAMGAEVLEVWKDVAGFMSADPTIIPEAQLIPRISYDEAAELAYFGAKILHPRTVEPLRRRKLQIAIKNTLNPDAPGSLISAKRLLAKTVIKSVAHQTDIGILKIHASGVGARPGILAEVAVCLAATGINIKSVVTSQTCISLLLSLRDLDAAQEALQGLTPRPYRKLEKVAGVALISIVGEGIARRKGIAARCFAAVEACGVNVEMISFGPSRVALYFLVRLKDLQKAVTAIHSTFFSQPRCLL